MVDLASSIPELRMERSWRKGLGTVRLASHSLFSDWTGAREKGLVTLGHILCLYQNLGRDYSLIFPRDPKIA